MKEEKSYNTCCFTGHRKLPEHKIEGILKHLDQEVDNLINQGVLDFVSGGAIGFDLIAASLIAAKKKMGKVVRLTFALPYPNHYEYWTECEKNCSTLCLPNRTKSFICPTNTASRSGNI